MINFAFTLLALGLASEAETDTQKLVAGAMLSASLSLALREISDSRDRRPVREYSDNGIWSERRE